jgi:hypothetical protein
MLQRDYSKRYEHQYAVRAFRGLLNCRRVVWCNVGVLKSRGTASPDMLAGGDREGIYVGCSGDRVGDSNPR